MDGYNAFCLYRAIRLHFTTESYDCFKYNFKTKVTHDHYELSKDRFRFQKLSRQYATQDAYIAFLAANFLTEKAPWAGDLIQDEARERYLERKKVQEALSYYVQKNCQWLFQLGTPDDLLVTKGDYPGLLFYTLRGDIELETLIVLNRLLHFFPTWNRTITETIRWPVFYMKCRKYAPFLQYDPTTMKKIVQKCLKGS